VRPPRFRHPASEQGRVRGQLCQVLETQSRSEHSSREIGTRIGPSEERRDCSNCYKHKWQRAFQTGLHYIPLQLPAYGGTWPRQGYRCSLISVLAKGWTRNLERVDRLGAFEEYLRQEGQQFLERIDDWLSANESRGANKKELRRIGVGVYEIQDGQLT
jgi:hypothetical protein